MEKGSRKKLYFEDAPDTVQDERINRGCDAAGLLILLARVIHTRDVFFRPAPNPALPRKIVSTGCLSPLGCVGKYLQDDGGIHGQKSCRPRWVSGGASKCIFFNAL